MRSVIFFLVLIIAIQSAPARAVAEGLDLRFLDETTSWIPYKEAMEHKASISFPITTPESAIQFAIREGLSSRVPLEKLMKEKGYSVWIYSVRKRTPSLSAEIMHERLEKGEITKADYDIYTKDLAEAGTFWEVTLQSRGMHPMYQCALHFKPTGEIVLLLEEDCNFEHGSL